VQVYIHVCVCIHICIYIRGLAEGSRALGGAEAAATAGEPIEGVSMGHDAYIHDIYV